jgi:hypothetical protein
MPQIEHPPGVHRPRQERDRERARRSSITYDAAGDVF